MNVSERRSRKGLLQLIGSLGIPNISREKWKFQIPTAQNKKSSDITRFIAIHVPRFDKSPSISPCKKKVHFCPNTVK